MPDAAKEIIHFAHANGFPAGSYQQIFNRLNRNYHCIAIEKFGHNPRFAISNNWQQSVNELIHFIEQQSQQPIYAIGHSFGGVVSFMTACQRPDLIKGLIMLDPPIVSNIERHMVRFVKKTKLIDKVTPAGKAQVRRRAWPVGTDIATHYKRSKLFRNFDPQCLQDYVDAVITERNQRLELAFDPEIEANIFRNLPDNINQYFGKLRCPTVLLTGEDTDVCRPRYLHNFIKGNKMSHNTVMGGHMFPLEYPEQTAQTLENILAQWTNC